MKPPLDITPNEARTLEAEICVASSFSPVGTALDEIIQKAAWMTMHVPVVVTDELREYAREVIATNPRYATPGAGLASVDETLAHMIACHIINRGLQTT